MRFLEKLIGIAAFVALLVVSFPTIQNYISTPCGTTLEYSIGTFDLRFGLDQDEFKEIVAEAAAIWDNEFDHTFFSYDESAAFTINLVFDERQNFTIAEQSFKEQLDGQAQTQDNFTAQYKMLVQKYEVTATAYEKALASYERDLRTYNTTVNQWNSRGGAPSNIKVTLERDRLALKQTFSKLEQDRTRLNGLAQNINAQTHEGNQLVEIYNNNVSTYNEQFGNARQFDQGDYQGDLINIYQFEGRNDLRLVLAHEFGHALGLEHVENPSSVMYFLMEKQNIANPGLTLEDRTALNIRCRN